MNIQSTSRSGHRVATPRAGAQEFQKARQDFVEAREEHYEVANTYDTWGGRASFAAGAATLGGVGYLIHLYAPSLEGYGAAFPAVFAAFGVGAAVAYGTKHLLGNTQATQDMMQTRETFAEKRDAYRKTLLAELNDEGVGAAHNPGWEKLKNHEDLSARMVTYYDNNLLKATDELALLADSRQGQGWQRALAQAQDSPSAFAQELELVQNNEGIREALVQGHGA
jgi:hypothetical protein